MKVKIIAIGKISANEAEYILCKEYIKRIKFSLEIKELRQSISQEELFNQICLITTEKDLIILLDANGKEFSSKEFSKNLYNLFETSRNIIFLIGGDVGFSEKIKNKVNLSWSLGKMTYPHKIARILILEQLYRAQTIYNNHPYDK